MFKCKYKHLLTMLIFVFFVTGCQSGNLFYLLDKENIKHPKGLPSYDLEEIKKTHVVIDDKEKLKKLMKLMSPKIEFLRSAPSRFWIILPHRLILSSLFWDPIFFWSYDSHYQVAVEFLLQPKWKKKNESNYWVIGIYNGWCHLDDNPFVDYYCMYYYDEYKK